MLQLFWNSFAYIGVSHARSISEEKHIILVNALVLMIIPVNIINSIIGISLHYPSFFALTTFIYSITLIVVLVLNSKGWLSIARVFFAASSYAFTCFFTILVGTEIQFQLFFLVGVFVGFFIFPARQKAVMYGMAFLYVSTFVVFELYYRAPGIIYLNAASLETRRVLSIFSVSIMIFAFAAYVKASFHVAEKAIEIEKEKSEKLLLNILPASVIKRLREKHETIAERLDKCTVLFSDLVGFSGLTRSLSAVEIVSLLNEIFCDFDDLAEKHGLEKIKTIGDAYMIVGGLLDDEEVNAAERVVSFAVDMLAVIHRYKTERQLPLEVRIGINTGDAVAGVIGKKKFTYDLWGDSVNTASRMESHGLPGQIQVTQSTYAIVKDKFSFSERGEIEVKGLGKIKSYLLLPEIA